MSEAENPTATAVSAPEAVPVQTAEACPAAADAEKGAAKAQRGPVLVPTRFEMAIVKYPCACCWCWFVFGLLWVFIMQMMFASKSLQFDPRGVWDVRSDPIQGQFDAFMIARGDSMSGFNESTLAVFEPRTQKMLGFWAFYFSVGETENLLTQEKLEWMHDVENKMMADTDYGDYCTLVHGASGTSYTLVALDAANGVVTMQGAGGVQPSDGDMLIFMGSSSVLTTSGHYHVRAREGAGEGVLLVTKDVRLNGDVVTFPDNSAISAGATFILAEGRCASVDSVAAFALVDAEAQQDFVCDGFNAHLAPDGVTSVHGSVCGCDAGDASFADPSSAPPGGTCQGPSCAPNCAGDFGVLPECTSSAFVTGQQSTWTSDATMGRLSDLCPGTTTGDGPYKMTRQRFISNDLTCSGIGVAATMSAKYVRSNFGIGGPRPGYRRIAGDEGDDQYGDIADWGVESWPDFIKIADEMNKDSRAGNAQVFIIGDHIIQQVFQALMATDASLAMGSIIFVWMWVWSSTGSTLLATGCSFETFVSLPMAMATWGLAGQKWLGFLSAMMLFVILGIGADDVFVLIDAWKQSGLLYDRDDLQNRFCWAYRRARNTMLLTTITTCFSFCAAGFSDVPSISGFGWFAALVVFWDYILCITFFASLTIVYTKYFEQRNACCPCCKGSCCQAHMFCCPIKCLKVGEVPLYRNLPIMGPFCFFFLLGLVATFFVPVAGCVIISGALIWVFAALGAQTDPTKDRPIESFFKNQYFPFVERHALKLVVFSWTVAIAGVLATAVMLRPPKEQSPFLSKDHPLQIYFNSMSNFAGAGEDNPMTWVNVIFGMEKDNALDRSGVDYQQPGTGWDQEAPEDALGAVNYHRGAMDAFLSEAGQTEIIEFTDLTRMNLEVSDNDENCEYVVYRGVSYPRMNPQADSGMRREDGDAGSYYVIESGSGHDLSSVSSAGFCNTGVYSIMYTARDYILHFCGDADLVAEFYPCDLANVPAGSNAMSSCREGQPELFAGLCQVVGNFPASNLGDILESDGFAQYIEEVVPTERLMNGMQYDFGKSRYLTGTGFDADGKIQFAWMGINGSIPEDLAPDQLGALHDLLSGWVSDNLEVNNQAFAVNFLFNWMLVQQALVSNTIQSLVLGIIFCWLLSVILTWNWRMGSLAVTSVLCIVFWALGFVSVIGWKLDIIESIVLIIILGISIDYSLHIAHAYVEAIEPETDSKGQTYADKRLIRAAKAKQSVGSLGISLVSGLITSVGSALYLLFCQLAFFRQFGQFLVITLIGSAIVTFVYLVPVLILIGPVGKEGSLCQLPFMKKEGGKETE